MTAAEGGSEAAQSPPPSPVPTTLRHGHLPLADRKGRFGVHYFCSVATQYGAETKETGPGQDHLAVDISVDFREGPVRVQLKCGTKRPTKGGWLTVSVRSDWRAKWDHAHVPVYLVYVVVAGDDPHEWIAHATGETLIRGHAYWERVDQRVTGGSVRVPLENRLTAETFDSWRADFLNGYGRGAS